MLPGEVKTEESIKQEEPDEEDVKPDHDYLSFQEPGPLDDFDQDYKPDLDYDAAPIEEDVKPELVTCEVCGERLLREELLDHHMSSHAAVVKKLGRYRCPHCRKESFPTNRELLEHYNACPRWTQPADWAAIGLNSPFLSMSQQVYCPVCVKLCNTFFYFSSHLQSHGAKGNFFQCTGCKSSFKNAYLLKEHLVRAATTSNLRCVNTAMIHEKLEAEKAIADNFTNRKRLLASRMDYLPPTLSYQPAQPRLQQQAHPTLLGDVPMVHTKRPRTIRDAESMEMRRSAYDARLKVRNEPSTSFQRPGPSIPRPISFVPVRASVIRDPPLFSSTKEENEVKQEIKDEPDVDFTAAPVRPAPDPLSVRRPQPVLEAAARIAAANVQPRPKFNAPAPVVTLNLSEMMTLSKFNSVVQCPFCTERQMNFESLDEHAAIYHPSLKHSLVFACSGCSEPYPTAEALRRHLLVQTKNRLRHRLCCNTATALVRAPTGLITIRHYINKSKPVERAEKSKYIGYVRQEHTARAQVPKEEDGMFDNGLLKEE